MMSVPPHPITLRRRSDGPPPQVPHDPRGPRPRSGPLVLQGRRLHGRGPRAPDRRRRALLDRDHPVQLEPSEARGEGEGGHPRGRRDPDRVQHGLRHRRHRDGYRGHEELPREPGGGGRLHRARGARAPLRRGGGHLRLRQDHSRDRHGAGPPESPGGDALRRLDHAGELRVPEAHRAGRLRGGGRLQRRPDLGP